MVTSNRHRRLLAGVTISAAMLIAACGSDKNTSSSATTASGGSATTAAAPQTTAAAAETTAAAAETTAAAPQTTAGSSGGSGKLVATAKGCEEHGVTDPDDLSVGRKPARCKPGFPEAKPLAQRTKLKVSSAFSLEFMSPILLAQSLGEFEKENMEIEMVNVSLADAIPQMAQGTIDAAVGGLEISLFNAGHQNLGVKSVMSNYFPPDAGNYKVPQTGLWCRKASFSNPADPDMAETQKMKWATSVGKGSSSIYYSAAELSKRVKDFDITQVQIEKIPSSDIVAALQNGAIDCGVLLDPLWLQVADSPDYVLAATQVPGEPLGVVAFGKSMLVDNPEAGEAFVRAVIRTINTYYDGDYHANAEVMNEIAKDTGVEVAKMTQVPSLVMDWEYRAATTTRIQDLFIKLGVITEFDKPVPEDDLIDRSFYYNAVGAKPA